jgi:hypothetical protein
VLIHVLGDGEEFHGPGLVQDIDDASPAFFLGKRHVFLLKYYRVD